MGRSEKEGEMKIWKRLSASVMTGFVIPTAEKLPKTKLRHQTSVASPAGTGEFIVLFGTLPPDISRKFPLHVKAAGQGATSPSNDDRRLQREALALITKAIEYIDREGSLINRCAVDDYREG
jgi:hypothetical protein